MDKFSAADQKRLERQLAKLGLSVSNINANCTRGYWGDLPEEPIFEPSILSPRRVLREWRIAYTRKALRLGQALGARNVSLTTGRSLPGIPPEKAQALLIETLKRLLDFADSLGQRLSLEYEPPLFVERTSELAGLMDTLKAPHFGANLDVGHVVASGEDPAKAFRALKGHIFNIHLADIRGRKHYPRIPGDGDLDFPALFKALDATGYDGPLTWELYTCADKPDAACRKTFTFVKSICN
jgi:sugar phosphate isomerase/epimerase